MEIRRLEVRDVFTVARMLSKVAGGVKSQMMSAMQDRDSINPMELGIDMFTSLFVETEDDMKGWMASLINKEQADFEVMPALTILDLIEGLAKQEDVRAFFIRASSLSISLDTSSEPLTQSKPDMDG